MLAAMRNALRKVHVFQSLAEYAKSKNGLISQFHCSATYKYLLQNIRRSDVIIRNTVLSKTELIRNVLIKRKYTENFFVDVNVKQNVLLYECLDTTSFRLLIPTAIIQNICWLTIAYCAYTPAIWTPKPKDVSWKHHYRPFVPAVALCVCSVLLGCLITTVIWFLCARSVKYIILHKGGEKITLVTYNINKRAAKKCIPVGHVRSTISREKMVHYMPLKVFGESFHYIIDRKGNFYHNKLFDNTIGIYKDWCNPKM